VASLSIYTFLYLDLQFMAIVSEADVINAISNEQSLDLFKAIAITKDSTTDIFRKKIKLTRKQYYSRMSRMIKTGLIKRKNGKYFLTSLGKIVYEAQAMIENALNDYWKLKAIDSLEGALNMELPTEERSKILDTLIDNHHIKEILLPKSI
jgi:predicted transcriptional regulator